MGLTALNELLNKLSRNDVMPDYIFLDLNMPIMNGWEFFRKPRES